jgi:hypothetical protein
MPVIHQTKRMRQEDYEFEASLGKKRKEKHPRFLKSQM